MTNDEILIATGITPLTEEQRETLKMLPRPAPRSLLSNQTHAASTNTAVP
jgi:hypothetical protein